MEVRHEGVTWRFDRTFLESNWTCIWGHGCKGILDHEASELGQGCCSVGAELDGLDEVHMVAASTVALHPDRFQFHGEAALGGVFNAEQTNTRVIDGACIFLNRPGFDGGSGCALHLAALVAEESPIDWKPSVCWQLPIRVEWEELDDQNERATVRKWSRQDWGDEGETMAWCCTEGPEAFVGDRPVIESLADEIEAVVGTAVFVKLRRRLQEPWLQQP